MATGKQQKGAQADAFAGMDGFEKIEGGELVPVVKYEHAGVTKGFIARFVETRTHTKDGEDYTTHVFEDANGVRFALWASAALDARMAKVGAGHVAAVRYDGKKPHPTDAKKTLHNWTVLAAKPDARPALVDAVAALGVELPESDDLPF